MTNELLQSRQKPMKRNQGEISELKTGASKLKVIGENQSRSNTREGKIMNLKTDQKALWSTEKVL